MRRIAVPDYQTARTWLTHATAVPATREADILALQVQCLDHIVKSPQSAGRE
jgi:hypothetical protein